MLISRGEKPLEVSNILRLNRRYSDDFFKQVGRLNIHEIKSKLEILLEADTNIKRSKFKPPLALEFTVIRLCLG